MNAHLVKAWLILWISRKICRIMMLPQAPTFFEPSRTLRETKHAGYNDIAVPPPPPISVLGTCTPDPPFSDASGCLGRTYYTAGSQSNCFSTPTLGFWHRTIALHYRHQNPHIIHLVNWMQNLDENGVQSKRFSASYWAQRSFWDRRTAKRLQFTVIVYSTVKLY